ncbi:MAG: hypothetical protein Q9181_007058 [Wetmoreana brouardii]
MPSITTFFGGPPRHARHSSTPQRPTSQSPAVKSPASPTASKKRSNASKASVRPPGRQEMNSANTSSVVQSPKEEVTRKSLEREDVDVFAYLHEDEEEEEDHHQTEDEQDEDPVDDHHTPDTTSPSPMSAHEPPSHYSDLEVNADQQIKRQTWHGAYNHAGSFHSDSGISMGSGSGDPDSPILQHKYPSIRRTSRLSSSSHEPPIPEHHGLNVLSDAFPIQQSAFGADAWPQWSTGASDNPEAYYVPRSHGFPPSIETTTCQLPVTPSELSPQLPRNRKEQPPKEPSRKKRGNPQLASAISSQDDAVLKPIYRKFEMLNNRILLYLQDEISALETEIEELDALVTREEQCMSGLVKQAKHSTRSQQRRVELMGECAAKVNMYNQALLSYSSLTQTLSTSSHTDITVYRKWITKHKAVAESEASFLRHRHDLVTVPPNRIHVTPMNLEYSPFIMALTILIHIVAFKFVPQILARLIMGAVMGMALLCMMSPASMLDVQFLKEKRRSVGL